MPPRPARLPGLLPLRAAVGRAGPALPAAAVLGGLATLLLGAPPLAAQAPPTGPASAGAPVPAVARARGAGAVAVNPAGLALPGGAAVILPSADVLVDLTPVTLQDLGRWSGRTVPASVRERWLEGIEAAGGEDGRGALALTWLAGRRGRLGASLVTTFATRARLNPAAAELLLFGNAGRTGEPRPLDAAGSRLDAWALTRAAVAAATARPLRLAGVDGTLALGAALGVTVGHGLLVARDAGTRVAGADPTVEVSFPRLETGGVSRPAGWGVGVDLGAAWEGAEWSLGAGVKDALGAFRWRRGELRYRAGRALFGEEGGSAPPADSVPPILLLDAVDAATPPPVLSAEAARRLGPRWEASVGVRSRLAPGLDPAPAVVAGASLAWAAAPWLEVRMGGGVAGGDAVWSAAVGASRGRLRVDVGGSGGPGGLRGLSLWLRLRPGGAPRGPRERRRSHGTTAATGPATAATGR